MSRDDTPRDTGPVEHVPADAPSAVIQQPFVDQNLLRESQAISLSQRCATESVYCNPDPFRRMP